ncbi:Hypothetical predicted protein [Mytilus galloprovincialis]|uniref:Mab-21-like HhH/H2TH-like domain-containing protein n=1 Tax=Mytilus galloprovincialis TaxID=29158 RepID=A0A8B6HB99_MYTGA|nr:Hypothetical predicted protein [Mytilus galloprovincialis]
MNTIRDNLSSDTTFVEITSGSFGEGLEMQGSDFDLMKIIKSIEICEDPNMPFFSDKTYFIIDRDDTQPGFTQLRLLYSNDEAIFDLCIERQREFYFSSSALKPQFSSNILPIVHGPCLSDKQGLFDLALCCHSKSWITPATQWITRSNNSWPDEVVKQYIVEHGTLFVPIGVKGSTNEEVEWRLSFSVGEKFLIYTFTHTQILCYALLKILLKDVIQMNLECDELLCSYFMKTILFWISEEFPPSVWRPENLICNFMRCFRRLIYCVENSVCPHYFIPDNNLFENKIKGHEKQILLNRLYVLNSCNWQCVLFSHQMSPFRREVLLSPIEPTFLHIYEIEKFLFSMINVSGCTTLNLTMKQRIRIALSFENSKIKHIYWYYISKFCRQSVQYLPFKDPFISCNKSNYKHYKICIRTLLENLRHDAVSGWLLLASFFYKSKLYSSAVHVLKYSLSKCTLDKMLPLQNLSIENYKLLNLKLFRKMTIVQLWKFLLLDCVIFYPHSTLIPHELQIEVMSDIRRIPPVVYAHFLLVLCHHRLNNEQQCRHSLQDLNLTIEENYLIPQPMGKFFSYEILGIAFQITGDIESAKSAFIQSIALEPNTVKNNSLWRLSSMSSRFL